MALIKKHGTYWMDPGWFPFTIGFVPTAKGWDKVCKHLNMKESPPYCPHAGSCSKLEHSENGQLCILICVTQWDTRSWADIAGIVAHECTHAFEFMCEHVGEQDPSPEFNAYGVQSFVTEVMQAIEIEREKLKKRKGKK